MGEGTKTISLADAMARIAMLESNVEFLQYDVANLQSTVATLAGEIAKMKPASATCIVEGAT